MSVTDDVWAEIKKQAKQGGEITPFSVSRALGYRLSGRISYCLKILEGQGLIRRRYESGNECFIHVAPIHYLEKESK